MQSPPGREFPSRDLDASLPGYANTTPPTVTAVDALVNTSDLVAAEHDLGPGGRNDSCENNTPEHACRHQTFPVVSQDSPVVTSYSTLVQRLATRGGGTEQPEGDGGVPTSTPRTRSKTGGAQQTGE